MTPDWYSAVTLAEKSALAVAAYLYMREGKQEAEQPLKELPRVPMKGPQKSSRMAEQVLLALICSVASVELSLLPYAFASLVMTLGAKSRAVTLPLTIVLFLDISGT